ncbi:alcohol dehydrogenase catalytic domain-containing protein, partial [Myxococcus sp. AB025B]
MEGTMRVMALHAPGQPLREERWPIPHPGPQEVLLRVRACAVCRTDLHLVDGELPRPKLPVVPGHEIVASVAEVGSEVLGLEPGTRVGVPWLGWTCGQCRFCVSGRENLCDFARFTGYQVDGGYAEYTLAHHAFCFPLPPGLDDAHAAPLMCAGLIGYRSLRMAGAGARLGMYGFGAAAHLLIQVARHRGRRVFAFT